MKRIICCDIEGDGLLEDITKVWCASLAVLNTKREVTHEYTVTKEREIGELFSNPDNILIMHNGLSFDAEAVDKVLGVKLRAEIIDTLFLSWYLNPKMLKHGLGPHGERLGISKPTIDDWENLSLDEYIHRCEEDVRIQVALWKEMWKQLMLLYQDKAKVWRAVRHISWKAQQAAMQQKARWKFNEKEATRLQILFSGKFKVSKEALEAEMPMVQIYKTMARPKKPFKKNGEASVTGLRWIDKCSIVGQDPSKGGEVKFPDGLKDPNAGSPLQLKDWLFSLGWEPVHFDFKRNKETGQVRKIPQVKEKDTGNLCPNIEVIARKIPALLHLREMSTVKHRLGIVEGLLKAVSPDGYIIAGVQGLTNTLRFKHRTALNLPSTRKPYGKEIRSLFMARAKNTELCGSDLASVEDRTKQHYMWKYDPDYVREMMQDDFDPHLDMAFAANLITEEEITFYKEMDHDTASEKEEAKYKDIADNKRYPGKTTNYAATYGAGGPTIARAAGVTEAIGHKLHKAYWERNWSLIAIADNCLVKQSRSMKWLWNPVAKLWVYLKAEKDRFSTLNQSTATYAFDRWVWHIARRRRQLTATFHDEVVHELLKGNRDKMSIILRDAMKDVNEELKLNRDLDCDISYGKDYSEIH